SNDTLFTSGILDAKMTVSDFDKRIPAFTGNFQITDFQLMEQPIGIVTGNADKLNDNTIEAAINIQGNGNNINAKGNYYLNDPNRDFDATLDITRLNLATLQGFTFGNVRDASGSVHGNINLQGKFSEPHWKGELDFDTTRFTLAQFGTPYLINNQKVVLDYPVVRLDNFTIRDSLSHELTID